VKRSPLSVSCNNYLLLAIVRFEPVHVKGFLSFSSPLVDGLLDILSQLTEGSQGWAGSVMLPYNHDPSSRANPAAVPKNKTFENCALEAIPFAPKPTYFLRKIDDVLGRFKVVNLTGLLAFRASGHAAKSPGWPLGRVGH
jgi:hypothetical protein